MNIFCDIDGTLTDSPNSKWGNPILLRIKKLKELSLVNTIILWSGNGTKYAKVFKKKYNLTHCLAIGKPHIIIDDNITIRPKWNTLIKNPKYLQEIK